MRFYIDYINQPLSRVAISVCAHPSAAPLFARVNYSSGTVVIGAALRSARQRPASTRARRRVLADRRGSTPIPVANRRK